MPTDEQPMKLLEFPERATPADILDVAKTENFSFVVVVGVTEGEIITLSNLDDPQAHWVLAQASYCLIRSEIDGE